MGFFSIFTVEKAGWNRPVMAVGVAETSHPEDQEAVIMRQEVSHAPVTGFCHSDPTS